MMTIGTYIHCSRHGLIQAKIVFKIHFTRSKLSRIYPGVSDACLRCGLAPADHLHTFISCPRLHPFWNGIFDAVNSAYNTNYDFDPLLALFGVSPGPLNPRFINNVSFITLVARRLILLNWKNVRPPSLVRWYRETLSCIKLEKLRFTNKGCLSSFDTTWKPLIIFLDAKLIMTNVSQ